jgi:hypothetical protein
MLEVLAEITMLGASRGGLEKPVRNGFFRPSFGYAGQLVACDIWADPPEDFVPIERPFRARIKLAYGDQLGWTFVGGEQFELCVASQVIGHGVILAGEPT